MAIGAGGCVFANSQADVLSCWRRNYYIQHCTRLNARFSVTRAPGHSSLGMSAPAELSQKNSFACFERGDSTPQLEQAAAQRSVCTATGHEAWQRIAGGLGFVLQSQILRWFAVLDEFSVTFAKSN